MVLRRFARIMGLGGGGRYPYPKYVWSPAGGWWGQPKNWKVNTLVVSVGIGAISLALFDYSTKREVCCIYVPRMGKYSQVLQERYIAPKKWIPSQLWSEVKIGPKDTA
ncbi:hypothetical protein CYLTODRAFT_409919 [Cylindrobasidium torrendii FP15055 ss-10]|uniref:Uncharacterized protein n=1 Tax=Cylindrobasidium torrendii FP15055 ss-10 TaxID=1314674 RepID=A0A0D7BHD3_9AGAR|nr:hypothetical protein CYLTODRAFT_409919 [Cylindrobasidium torrendii FP15055 ss-10]